MWLQRARLKNSSFFNLLDNVTGNLNLVAASAVVIWNHLAARAFSFEILVNDRELIVDNSWNKNAGPFSEAEMFAFIKLLVGVQPRGQ